MIVNARSLPQNQVVETDICIVGSGTAGMTLARELVGKNFRVCLLESGGRKAGRKEQSLYWGENIGRPYFPLDTARARYFGGSTNRWHVPLGGDFLGARMRSLDAIDFEEREEVPFSGWPFTKAHIEPYYQRADEILRIGPPTYEVGYWEDKKERPRLPLDEQTVETVIFKFGSKDPFVNEYYDQVINADNIITFLYANVLDIETTETGDTVTRLQAGTFEGNKFWVSAKIAVLAAGGLETPRLLLLSNRVQKKGLGNQHDLVGRFFMEHLHFQSGILIPSRSDFFKRTRLYNSVHQVGNVPIIGKLGLSESTLRREKLLNYSMELLPRTVLERYVQRVSEELVSSKSVSALKTIKASLKRGAVPNEMGKHLSDIVGGFDEIAVACFRKLSEKLYKEKTNVFLLAHMTEQVPNPESRVTLGEERDPFGQRRMQLDWRLSSIDVESTCRAQKIIDREIRRTGLGKILFQMDENTPPPRITGGWHHMGTTRMHDDPEKGVVDANSKVHGLSNLYIAGPSVFPTGGYANPCLTIIALAVRLADYLKEQLK